MGNQICCQQTVSPQKKQLVYELQPRIETLSNYSQDNFHHHPQIPLPQLTKQVLEVLNQYKPFDTEFNQQEDRRTARFGSDVYFGPLDETGRPNNFGKMYKPNGALFIGIFMGGVAQGPCFYVMNDGSFYRGQMRNNTANCQSDGEFVTKNFQYTGGFKDNQFHGKGKQRASDKNYQFEGFYENGKKVEGTMKWREKTSDHVYTGKFNAEGKFQGKGRYTDPQGTYQGDFVNGQKHGFGIYYYKSKLRYEGNYVHNKKQGEGKIVNFDGTIAYMGKFDNGMPNGKGIATSRSGMQFEAEWENGIDKRHL